MKDFILSRTCQLVLCVMTFLCTFNNYGATYTINSVSQFNSLSLAPGDVVIWTNGTYNIDQNISFTTNGTASNPILLKAETPGGVIFTGETTMDISGDYVIVDGFYWNGGAGTNNHVQFRKSSAYANNSIIRNCAFNNLTPSGTDKHRWIVLYGTNNVVENCSFLNKNSPGALILVELEYNDFNPVGHIIRNNYFFNFIKRDPTTTHSGDSETIRVGTSEFQDKSASVTVEGNYFYKADGENEIITNKSADNTYRNNTFRRCRGSLVMRHGAHATVDGNYFLGENVEGTGGIRITDSYHVITNNYIQDVISTDDKWNNGITLVGGQDISGGITNGYQKVDGIVVAFNTLYNVDSPIFYNDRSSYDPTGVLAYNVIYSTLSTIVGGDISGTGQGMTYEGNVFGGSAVGISNSGIINANANFSANGEIFKPSATGPAANSAGSSYSATVNYDVEGRIRPNTTMDAGAHEVSGGSGSVTFAPHTNSMVGVSVGASFLDATGSTSTSDYLTVASVGDFTSIASTKTVNITSNVGWVVTDNQSWVTVTPTSGSGNGTINITATANSSFTTRTATVTVTGSGLSANTITITQTGITENIDVTGVSLSSTSSSLVIGSSQQLFSTVLPNNASNKELSYSTNDSAVASVSESGLVTAKTPGSATITVTTEDGNFTDLVVINVLEVSNKTNLALNKSTTGTGTVDGTNIAANLVDGDTNTRWSVSGFPQSAIINLGGEFSIGSTEVICYSDRAYQYTISVSSTENGTYTEVVNRSTNSTPGSVSAPIIDTFTNILARYIKITVTGASDYTGSWVSLLELGVYAGEEVATTIGVTSVSLTPSNATLTVGASQQLSAGISPSNATNQAIIYSSSNNTVATVNTSGLVTAISSGSTTITVKTIDGLYTDSSTISILPTPVVVTNIALGKSVSFSTEQSENPASNLVDGDSDTRWSAQTYPEWVLIDLGSLYTVNSTEVICFEDRAYQYTIEISVDGSTFTQVVNRNNNTSGGFNTAPISDTFANIDARYVRITISGAASYSGDWASIDELRVFGSPSLTAAKTSLSPAKSSTSIPEEAVTLWPNPASNIVNIVGAEKFHTITVYDMTGKLVIKQAIQDDTIDISSLNSGLHVFKLSGDNKTNIQRIIKK